MNQFIQENIDKLDLLQVDSFYNLLNSLDDFFEEESLTSIYDDHRLKFFSSAALESTDIIRASSSFHGKPMFSNVIISGEVEGKKINWYGLVRIKILILLLFMIY